MIWVRIITNSMATTDEPLASLAYERYRMPLLKMGIDLYELRPLKGTPENRNGPGASRSRWHAKMAFINRKTMILGSMNLDQRLKVRVSRTGSKTRAAAIQRWMQTAIREEDVAHQTAVRSVPPLHLFFQGGQRFIERQRMGGPGVVPKTRELAGARLGKDV